MTVQPPDLNDCGVQKLLLQALRGDKEVEEGDLDRDFWWVMGVCQLAGHVEAEIWVVGDHIVPNLDDLAATLHSKYVTFCHFTLVAGNRHFHVLGNIGTTCDPYCLVNGGYLL